MVALLMKKILSIMDLLNCLNILKITHNFTTILEIQDIILPIVCMGVKLGLSH
jgi:hypothetical protein